MIYKDVLGMQISALGMGTMRLPVIGGKDKDVDEALAEQMIDCAYAHGVNYFDTAWGYHAGKSELITGAALKKYPRESFYLADKFPGYDLSNMGKVKEIFEAQLKKCQVDYFDFYLIHNVCEVNIEQYLDPQFGTYEYLMEQKKNGRIRHLGFSVHGSFEVMKRFMAVYGKDMEFCQIQLNWFDWDFQNAKAKVELLNELNIPIIVMEPLRGGKLVNLNEKYVAQMKAMRPEESVPGWAFRYLQSVPGVKIVLSGMSDMAQLEDNLAIFAEDKPLNEKETALLFDIATDMRSAGTLPCTACHYCTEHCPQGLDIPRLLELYNEELLNKGSWVPVFGLMTIEKDKKPSDCLACRSCEEVCPQQLKIADALKDFAARVKDA